MPKDGIRKNTVNNHNNTQTIRKMNKAQANQALEMGHAIRHNSSLPDGYYYINAVTNTITIDGKEKEIVEKQVFDENQECMGNPDIFFQGISSFDIL